MYASARAELSPPAGRRGRRARSGGSCWSWPRACPGESRGLVDEDQALGIKPALIHPPAGPPPGDVGAILFAGVQAFFECDPLMGEEPPHRAVARRRPAP